MRGPVCVRRGKEKAQTCRRGYVCKCVCTRALIKTEMKTVGGGGSEGLGEKILCAHQQGFTDEEAEGLSSSPSFPLQATELPAAATA